MLDEFRSTSITWDKATSRIYSPVTANESDENGRKLVVQIVNGGQVEDLTGATLHLYWETRDKAHDGLDVFKAVDLKKGEFELSYTTGMLSNQGVLNANLVLIDTVGRVVSERFKITVTEGIDNDAIQSENSFTTLTQALIDVSNLETNYAPRLNDLTAQLQQTSQELNERVRVLKKGEIKLPSDFPKLPFKVYKKDNGVYTHDANAYNQYDWSDATEVFISTTESTNVTSATLGTDANEPILQARFVARLQDGSYGSQKKFIITFINNLYNVTTVINWGSLGINILFRSGSINGHTWLGRMRDQNNPSDITTKWTLENGIYKTTQSSPHQNLHPVNYVTADAYGIPKPYKAVNSIAEVQAEKGTYYQATDDYLDIYLNPFDGDNVADILLYIKTSNIDVTNVGNVIMFENIGFNASTYSWAGQSLNAKFYFFNCKFNRGLYDAFAIDGIYKTYLFDCVGAYATKDAFNYHADSTDSLAVEVNCIGYGSGQFKLPNGNTTTASNNGSTAHDGMYMLRVGGQYWECEGPIVADINNCYSISIGCNSANVLETTDGLKAGFYVGNDVGTTHVQEKPKYIIECSQSGKHFEVGIASINSSKTNYQNFVGHKNVIGNPNKINWEDVV